MRMNLRSVAPATTCASSSNRNGKTYARRARKKKLVTQTRGSVLASATSIFIPDVNWPPLRSTQYSVLPPVSRCMPVTWFSHPSNLLSRHHPHQRHLYTYLRRNGRQMHSNVSRPQSSLNDQLRSLNKMIPILSKCVN